MVTHYNSKIIVESHMTYTAESTSQGKTFKERCLILENH